MLEYPGFDPLERSLDDLLVQISALHADIQANWPELGRALILLKGICGQRGHLSSLFQRLGVAPSTANDLMLLVRRFDGMGTEPPRDVPWRHLVEVHRYLNIIDMDWVLNFCRTHGREETADFVREGYFD